MILGSNISIAVVRRTTTNDAVGGAIYSDSTLRSGLPARIGNASSGQQMALKDMGYESARGHQIRTQPADLDVKENDLIETTGGVYNGKKFIVRQVKRDSILPTDSRSHVDLVVERLEEARAEP